MVAACRKGDHVRVGQLLAYGVSPHLADGDQGLLALASIGGHLSIVRQLLRAGAHPSQADLVHGIRSGVVAVADCLLDELVLTGVLFDFWARDRPLLTEKGFLAAVSPEMLSWMIRNGADPRECDPLGRDAYAAAVRDAAPEPIRRLLGSSTVG